MTYNENFNISPTAKRINSDVFTLTSVKSGLQVALIPSDSAGTFAYSGITRAPLERNAMKTTTGTSDYADFEEPWMSTPDEEWSGGRGLKLFKDDKTRYLDGKRAQTAFQGIFNAPLDYYSTGYKKAHTNVPDSLVWRNILNNEITQTFSPVESFTAGQLYLHVRKRGNPASDLFVELWDNMTWTGDPLFEGRYTTGWVTDTTAEFFKFELSVPLEASKQYYLRIYTNQRTANKKNCWQIGTRNIGGEEICYESIAGGKSQVADFYVFYRFSEAQDNNIRWKFFTYQQLTFAVRQDVTGGAPELWLNGDIGMMTGYANGIVTDNNKQWNYGVYKDAQVGLVYGMGIENHISCWSKITNNSANTLTLESPYIGVLPESGTTYIINDTPHWHKIENHGLTGWVTDVNVSRNIVYFCQGDHIPVRLMEWYNGAFQFKDWDYTTEEETEGETETVHHPVCAMFLRTVRDQDGLMLWKANNDDEFHNRSVARARLIDNLHYKADEETAETDIITLYDRTEALTPTNKTQFSDVIDFTRGDFDGLLYKAEIGNFTSTDNTGKLTLTLQGSWDGANFEDVKDFPNVIAGGTVWLDCYCEYPYRRIKAIVAGTSASVATIKVSTWNIPRFDETKITLFDNYGKITGLFEYGAEQTKSIWIMQEGMLSSVNRYNYQGEITYTHDRINIDELERTAEEWNASTFITSDVYLVFAWLNGIQRYYNTQLEGKGPDKDEGLPFEPINRQGRVTKLLSYPSNFFCSVDGGEDGYSSVLMFNQSGWHEIYRAPNVGERIHDMEFQPIYGWRPDRLWMQVGDEIVWLSMPSKTLNALRDRHAEYTHESVVYSSWITAGMSDVEKLWQTMKIVADNLGDTCWVEADYRVDDEEIWHPVETLYTISPSQEEDLNPHGSVNGKRFQYRLRLQTTDYHQTPHVNVVVIEGIARVNVKYSYGFSFRNIKWKKDLNAEYEDLEPVELQNILDDWANKLEKLRLNSRYKIFDNKIVYLNATQTTVLNELSEGYIGQITVDEL